MADYYYVQLVYNAAGGSGAPTNTVGMSRTPGASMTLRIASAVPTRQYYVFKGWAFSSGQSSGMSGGTALSVNASTTAGSSNARTYNLYAAWQPETAVLSYNANGGSGAPASQTVNKNTWFTLRTGVPTRSGYEFVGWNTSSTATAATYQPGGQARIVSNMTLYAVWKVSNSTISTISSSVPIDGSTQGSVSISSINNSYTHQLTLSIGESSQVISLAAGVTSATFTIPSSWLSEVPNSTTGTALASLKTFNGSTQVGGTDVKTFSITVPANIVPVITVATDYVNSNATVDGWDILLQNYSQIKLTATASGGTGATVATFTFAGDGLSQTSASNEATSSVLTSSGSRSWTVTVTDSRGRTASTIVTDTVHEYFSPSIASLTAFRADSGGNRDDAAGTYIKATGVFDYSSCDSHNSLTVDKIEYQAEDAGSWTLGQNNAASGTAYTFGGGSITETKTFHVKLTLMDALGNSADFTVDIAPIVGYGFGLKNDRVHFGGPCKEPGFVCDFPTKLVNGHIVGSHSASGNYAKVVTFKTDVQTSANLLPPMVDGTYSGNGVQAVVSGGVATLSGTTTASGNAIIIPLSKAVVVPDNSYFHLFNSVANGSASPSFELSTSAGTTNIAPSFNPANRIFPVPSNRFGVTIDRVRFWLGNGVTLSGTFNPMLAMSSTAIPFEPYADASDLDIDNPLTLEYIRSGDTSPSRLTINFARDYTLNSFTSNNSADAYLHNLATATWNLYIGKSSSSDSVEILDFHNPWSNTDMTIEWEDTSISTLPTGATQATGACKTGTMTLGNGATALGEIRVKQSGRVVNVSGYAQGTFSSGTTGYLLGTISGVDMPSNYIRAVGGCGSQNYYAYNSAYLILDPSTGDFTARCSANSSYVTFNLTYIAD